MASSEKFCLRWNDFETNISVAFRELREEKDFFDVTLACDDSQIQAHKVILSACSPFFRNVLRRNPHQHPLLYLKGVKYKELLSVLNFMYQGEVNVAQEELNSFLAVAEDLRVKGLTQNNSSSDKPKSEPPKISRPPPRDPPERDPVPPPKRPRPTPVPAPTSSYQQQDDDDDIQEVVPVKSEPRDNSSTLSTVPPDNSGYGQPQQAAPHHPSPALQQQAQAQAVAGQDGALALDDSYADESYDYGQYGDGGYDDGSGMIDPNTGMPIQGAGGADGNKGFEDEYHLLMKAFVEGKLVQVDKNKFQCTDCDHSSNYRQNMIKHIESRHVEQACLACPHCDKLCPSRNALSTHISRKHRNTK